MNFADGLDGVQMIYTRIKANLVEYDYTSSLCLGIELSHGRVDVAGGDNVRLALDSCTNNSSMIRVGDEGNHKVMFSDCLFQSFSIINIERNSGGGGKRTSECLGRREGPTSCLIVRTLFMSISISF